MNAFLIAHITVKDPEKLQAYINLAGVTLKAYGAEFVVKGKMVKTLAGELNSHLVAVIKFSDQAAIEAWYHSADYQALIPNRDAAADMVFITYDVPPS